MLHQQPLRSKSNLKHKNKRNTTKYKTNQNMRKELKLKHLTGTVSKKHGSKHIFTGGHRITSRLNQIKNVKNGVCSLAKSHGALYTRTYCKECALKRREIAKLYRRKKNVLSIDAVYKK